MAHSPARLRRRLHLCLLLALLASPAIARAQHRSKPSQPHAHAVGRVKESPRGSGSARGGGSSGSNDDDDGGGEAVGEILGGCCGGIMQAIADSNTSSDAAAEVQRPEEAQLGGPPADEGPGPLDVDAAREAVNRAEAHAARECPPAPPGSMRVFLELRPSGEVAQVWFEPAWTDPLAECFERLFRTATVPPFAGEPTVVVRTLALPPAPAP